MEAEKFHRNIERTGRGTMDTPEGPVTYEMPRGGKPDDMVLVTKGENGREYRLVPQPRVGDPAKIGIVVYPGARQEPSGERGMGGSPVPEGTEMTKVSYTTNESYDKVVAFYRGKYPKAVARDGGAEGTRALTLNFGDTYDSQMVLLAEPSGVVATKMMR
jgi:hypothetical protein